ncbi:MAG: hypothetical protein FWF05_06285 [Oscillospiraceae bacterium]|nr:hypothetical protein [Oscillospiraceae bacterium]
MSGEMKNKKEQDKIILPKELQIKMMEFFFKTSIPRKKKQEQLRLSKPNNGSDT